LSRDKQPDAIGDAVSEEKPEEKESMGVSGKE
jgi:hypothetical protein